MAVDLKANFGPILLVARIRHRLEQGQVLSTDAGRQISIAPAAWQVALGYQFDWNPWVEAIGSQGTYVAIGYSQSQDLAGVTLTTTAGATNG